MEAQAHSAIDRQRRSVKGPLTVRRKDPPKPGKPPPSRTPEAHRGYSERNLGIVKPPMMTHAEARMDRYHPGRNYRVRDLRSTE